MPKIEVDEVQIPEGARLVEAYETSTQIVVCGDVDADDETHSCDAMGCGFGHVTHRFDKDVYERLDRATRLLGKTHGALAAHANSIHDFGHTRAVIAEASAFLKEADR